MNLIYLIIFYFIGFYIFYQFERAFQDAHPPKRALFEPPMAWPSVLALLWFVYVFLYLIAYIVYLIQNMKKNKSFKFTKKIQRSFIYNFFYKKIV